MRYIKFILTRGEPITLPEDKAEAFLASSETLIRVTDKDGRWTGETLHKSHIVQTMRDTEAEKEEKRKNLRLAAPRRENTGMVDLSKFRPSFLRDDSKQA